MVIKKEVKNSGSKNEINQKLCIMSVKLKSTQFFLVFLLTTIYHHDNM